MIPPFGCKRVRGLVESLPVHSCWIHVIVEPIESHQLKWWIMATSTYGDLCHSSRRVGMMLQNISTNEVRIPPKTEIGNVQMAEIVPAMKVFNQMHEGLPLEKQKETSRVSQPTCLNCPQNELTPVSPQLEPDGLASEHDVLNKVDLLGCTKCRPWGPTGSEQNFKRVCGCLC